MATVKYPAMWKLDLLSIKVRQMISPCNFVCCNFILKFFSAQAGGNMAEWSKAVRSGRILNWRGFKSHCCHFSAAGSVVVMLSSKQRSKHLKRRMLYPKRTFVFSF